MITYPKLKRLAIDIVDDFFNGDLLLNYGPGEAYSSKTKLDDITVTAPKRAMMIDRVNRVFAEAAGKNWRDVRPVDTVKCTTIGDFIKLMCKHSGIGMPAGEPK
jgi:hypothetical protein